MTFRENIDKDELAEYPVSGFTGEIILVDDPETLKLSIEYLRDSSLLGFDTETKPSFRKGRKNGVGLLQLSDGNKAFLFRINHLGLPGDLAALLEDKSVTKAGVAIRDDIKGLKKFGNFREQGFIELQDYVRKFGIQSSGLRKLSAIILGFSISKRQQVSNWEAPELTEAQLKYAATDAWVCYEIYRKLRDFGIYSERYEQ